MTPEQLAREALDLAGRATPGPWECIGGEFVSFIGRCFFNVVSQPEADGERSFIVPGRADLENCDFIAHAGTHYATIAQSLLDTLAQLKAAEEREGMLKECLIKISQPINAWEDADLITAQSQWAQACLSSCYPDKSPASGEGGG